MEVSDCCDAKIIYADICSECMEHCGGYEDEWSIYWSIYWIMEI